MACEPDSHLHGSNIWQSAVCEGGLTCHQELLLEPCIILSCSSQFQCHAVTLTQQQRSPAWKMFVYNQWWSETRCTKTGYGFYSSMDRCAWKRFHGRWCSEVWRHGRYNCSEHDSRSNPGSYSLFLLTWNERSGSLSAFLSLLKTYLYSRGPRTGSAILWSVPWAALYKFRNTKRHTCEELVCYQYLSPSHFLVTALT